MMKKKEDRQEKKVFGNRNIWREEKLRKLRKKINRD